MEHQTNRFARGAAVVFLRGWKPDSYSSFSTGSRFHKQQLYGALALRGLHHNTRVKCIEALNAEAEKLMSRSAYLVSRLLATLAALALAVASFAILFETMPHPLGYVAYLVPAIMFVTLAVTFWMISVYRAAAVDQKIAQLARTFGISYCSVGNGMWSSEYLAFQGKRIYCARFVVVEPLSPKEEASHAMRSKMKFSGSLERAPSQETTRASSAFRGSGTNTEPLPAAIV